MNKSMNAVQVPIYSSMQGVVGMMNALKTHKTLAPVLVPLEFLLLSSMKNGVQQ